MRLARELINLPVVSIDQGLELGKVKDLYLDDLLNSITAYHLGSEGFLNRSVSFIRQADVDNVGQDAILVRTADVLLDEAEMPEISEWKKSWVGLSDLRGRVMKTPGGTKIGRLGDIILDEDAKVAGFSLSETFVIGPVAENKAVSRSALAEPEKGKHPDVLTIILAEAERTNLRVEQENFLSEPTVNPTEQETISADA